MLKRCLYGLFPTYKDSPLPTRWNRVLAVGDASGVQSPLSFGGFGALTRHLGRVTASVEDALRNDALDRAVAVPPPAARNLFVIVLSFGL